ncbi:hypothetical protein [Elioraea sp.]|uniref:hypothetical protein n=1 Tax=Elioraea sp. TaxID=2185103 RepID=UPI0025BA85B4|nr:hypothetical protein [Elioraea sp.]
MSRIYIALVETGSDWITFCRAHFIKTALTNCAGVFLLKSGVPPPIAIVNEDGWVLWLCGHGNAQVVCGMAPKDLATLIAPALPSAAGMINVVSCATGQGSAQDFARALKAKGKTAILKAPQNNNTFTHELGFRVLEDPAGLPSGFDVSATYKQVKATHQVAIDAATKVVDAAKGGTMDLDNACERVAEMTKAFWTDFTKAFAGCWSMPGSGWKAIST